MSARPRWLRSLQAQHRGRSMGLESGFSIGGREVVPLEGRIVGPAGTLRVEPKAMAVLLELARHAGEPRSRAQIESVVWPRGHICEDVLTRVIGQLRRALGDDARPPAVLETIPRRGYRLCVATQPLSRHQAASAARQESLLVLPFRHLAPHGDAFIVDGLTELLILRLCSLRGVRTLSRTTSMQFAAADTCLAQIAARSGADWIVEGTVLQAGDQVQVIVQLVDARTDAHLWAADYTCGLQDVLAMQNEIAERVAAAIRAQLGTGVCAPAAPPSLAPETMRAYLRGRQLLSRRTVPALREALQAFETVAAAAPGCAPAWASRAECEMLLMHDGAERPDTLLGLCEQHLEHALALDPQLGIGLSTRAALRFFFALDFDGAARDLERALELLPSYGPVMVQLASVAAMRLRFAEAHAWIEQALLVDAFDVGINMNVGDHMILQRRPAEAVQALHRALLIEPAHRPSKLRLAWALALGGQGEAAAARLAASRSNASGGEDDAVWQEYAALVAAALGDTGKAARHADELQRLAATQRVTSWSLARAAAAAGRLDLALYALAAAAEERTSSWPFLRLTPAFDALHGKARFEALAQRLPRPPHA